VFTKYGEQWLERSAVEIHLMCRNDYDDNESAVTERSPVQIRVGGLLAGVNVLYSCLFYFRITDKFYPIFKKLKDDVPKK